jgi:hypothetical protein
MNCIAKRSSANIFPRAARYTCYVKESHVAREPRFGHLWYRHFPKCFRRTSNTWMLFYITNSQHVSVEAAIIRRTCLLKAIVLALYVLHSADRVKECLKGFSIYVCWEQEKCRQLYSIKGSCYCKGVPYTNVT